MPALRTLRADQVRVGDILDPLTGARVVDVERWRITDATRPDQVGTEEIVLTDQHGNPWPFAPSDLVDVTRERTLRAV